MTQYYSRVERPFEGNRIFTIPFPYLDENDISRSVFSSEIIVNHEVRELFGTVIRLKN